MNMTLSDSLKLTWKQLWCNHKWTIEHDGIFEYQKGEQKIRVMISGKLLRCTKCGKQKFWYNFQKN